MILVVGAGPAGLALAYYLQQHGLRYRVLEKHDVGHSWANHYDRLHLHTLKEVSALPGLPMPASYPRFPSAHQLHAYLQRYAEHFKLNIQTDTDVHAASYHGPSDGWRVQTSQGDLRADALVAATGIWSTPFTPCLGGEEQFGGAIMHASRYRNPEPFRGQRVLVVGVGNSGSEIAVDLSEHGVETSIAIREGGSFVAYPTSALAMRAMAWFFRHAPRVLSKPLLQQGRKRFDHIGITTHPRAPLDVYPVVGFELPEAVAAGAITVRRAAVGFVPGGVRFADDSEAPFDSVIMATGYRPTLDFVAHELEWDANGMPRLHGERATRNPHLYCVGFHYPTTAGWLQSIGRVAHRTVNQLE